MDGGDMGGMGDMDGKWGIWMEWQIWMGVGVADMDASGNVKNSIQIEFQKLNLHIFSELLETLHPVSLLGLCPGPTGRLSLSPPEPLLTFRTLNITKGHQPFTNSIWNTKTML